MAGTSIVKATSARHGVKFVMRLHVQMLNPSQLKCQTSSSDMGRPDEKLAHHLEHRLQDIFRIFSVLMTWLVFWSAEVICRCRIGAKVRTSYENMSGRNGLQPIAIVVERVMFKFITDKNSRRKMESDWDHGYLLGVNPGTTEYLTGTSDDVYSCATMRRLEEDKAFDTAVIKEVDMHYRDYVIQGRQVISS